MDIDSARPIMRQSLVGQNAAVRPYTTSQVHGPIPSMRTNVTSKLDPQGVFDPTSAFPAHWTGCELFWRPHGGNGEAHGDLPRKRPPESKELITLLTGLHVLPVALGPTSPPSSALGNRRAGTQGYFLSCCHNNFFVVPPLFRVTRSSFRRSRPVAWCKSGRVFA